jgi:hypothetical protein
MAHNPTIQNPKGPIIGYFRPLFEQHITHQWVEHLVQRERLESSTLSKMLSPAHSGAICHILATLVQRSPFYSVAIETGLLPSSKIDLHVNTDWIGLVPPNANRPLDRIPAALEDEKRRNPWTRYRQPTTSQKTQT